MNFKETIQGEEVVKVYDNGAIVKNLNQEINFHNTPQSMESQIIDIKNTIDLLLLKQEGLI